MYLNLGAGRERGESAVCLPWWREGKECNHSLLFLFLLLERCFVASDEARRLDELSLVLSRRDSDDFFLARMLSVGVSDPSLEPESVTGSLEDSVEESCA